MAFASCSILVVKKKIGFKSQGKYTIKVSIWKKKVCKYKTKISM